jgi:hypothetical protein
MKILAFFASLLLAAIALFYENRREWTDEYDGLSKIGKIADLRLAQAGSFIASGGISAQEALDRAERRASTAGRIDDEINFNSWLKAQKDKDRPVVYALAGVSLVLLLISIFKSSGHDRQNANLTAQQPTSPNFLLKRAALTAIIGIALRLIGSVILSAIQANSSSPATYQIGYAILVWLECVSLIFFRKRHGQHHMNLLVS